MQVSMLGRTSDFCAQLLGVEGKGFLKRRILKSRLIFGAFTMAQCSSSNGPMPEKVLQLSNINPHMRAMEYVVRDPVEMRVAEIEKQLQNGVKKPFSQVIRVNTEDAHALGQQPISFIRQVVALTAYPQLIDELHVPNDVKSKARQLLAEANGGSLGAYTDSSGLQVIRKHVAEYIERRDGGIPAKHEDVILCAGASDGIEATMKLFANGAQGKDKPGVLIPIPQYPLYSAILEEHGLAQAGYYLNEGKNWGLEVSELERAFGEASKTCKVKVIVVINPGNPTGQVLSRENVEEIIKFAHKQKLFIFADEVNQDNIFAKGCTFHSFKKVLMELGAPYNQMELASFFSISKGYAGDCGLRGGYREVINVDPDVKAMLIKSTSFTCPPTLGQAALDCVVDPPKKGDPSFDQWLEEKTFILDSLALRAKLVVDILNTLPGLQCNNVQGGMYAFPQLTLPPKAVEAARAKGQEPDVFYALELLENTGICVVSGSDFGQKPGTYHLRITILPQSEFLDTMLQRFGHFHRQFMEKFA